MGSIINQTKKRQKTFTNLADYIYDKMLQQDQFSFQFLNPWSWVTLISGLLSGLACIGVFWLTCKYRQFHFLLLARGGRALPLPQLVLELSTTTTTPPDYLNLWTDHMRSLSGILPVESLILACLLLIIVLTLSSRLRRCSLSTYTHNSEKK